MNQFKRKGISWMASQMVHLAEQRLATEVQKRSGGAVKPEKWFTLYQVPVSETLLKKYEK